MENEYQLEEKLLKAFRTYHVPFQILWTGAIKEFMIDAIYKVDGTKLTEDEIELLWKTECTECKHYRCYDDGDGRWDVWCERMPFDKSPPDHYPKFCEKYEDDGYE